MPHVYIIGADDGGPVKIGFTSREPADRLVQIRNGSPRDLRVLAAAEGSLDDERALHRVLGEHRIRGEWFERSDEVEAAISDLAGALLMARRTKPRPAERLPLVHKGNPGHALRVLRTDPARWQGAPPTLDDVCARLGSLGIKASKSQLSRWERGLSRRMSFGMLVGLLDALEATPSERAAVMTRPATVARTEAA